MKKMMLLMLTLLIWVAASMNAQVRIGGDNDPNTQAVLDLNKNDGTNDKGLLLPNVALRATDDYYPMTAHVKGMTVYNTSSDGDVIPGVYINNGSAWVRTIGTDRVIVPATNVSTHYESGIPTTFSFKGWISVKLGVSPALRFDIPWQGSSQQWMCISPWGSVFATNDTVVFHGSQLGTFVPVEVDVNIYCYEPVF